MPANPYLEDATETKVNPYLESANPYLEDDAAKVKGMAAATRATVGVVGRAIAATDFAIKHSPEILEIIPNSTNDEWGRPLDPRGRNPAQENPSAGRGRTPESSFSDLMTPFVPLREAFSQGAQLSYLAGLQPEGTAKKTLAMAGGIVSGAEDVVGGAMEFMTSPVGLATLGLGTAPAALKAIVSATFAADMASHAPEALEEYLTAPDNPSKARALIKGLGNLSMAGIAGSHAYGQARAAITKPTVADPNLAVLKKVAPLTAEAASKVTPEDIPIALPKDIPISPTPLTTEAVAKVVEKEPVPETPTPTPAAVAGESGSTPVTAGEPPAKASVTSEVTITKPESERTITMEGGGNPTAMKYRLIDAEREQRGLPALSKSESVSDQAVMDRATAAIEADNTLPSRLVSELNENPRVIEDWENHVLLLKKIELRRDFEQAARESENAFTNGREDLREAANHRTAELSQQLTELESASRLSGSKRGSALRSLRVMVNEDMSLASLEMRARADIGGAQISPEHRSELQKVADEYKAKAEAEEARRREVEEQLVVVEAQKALAEAKAATSTAPLYEPRVLAAAEKFASFMDKKGEDALARIKARLGRTSAGIDPTILSDVGILGAAKITRGVVDFAKWTEAMVKDVGEWFREHAQEAWDTAQQVFGKESDNLHKGVSRATREKIKKAAAAPTPAVSRASIVEGLTEAVKEGATTPEIGKYARKIAEGFIRDGITEIEPLTDAVHGVLKTVLPEITRTESRDAWTNYGKYKMLDMDAVKVRLRELSTEGQKLSTIERLEAGQPGLKTGQERQPPTDSARRMQKRINELKKQAGIVTTDRATQLRSAMEAIKTRNSNRIKDLRFENSTRTRIVKNKRVALTDAEIEAQRAEIAELTRHNEEIFGGKDLTQEQRLARAISAAERAEAAGGVTLTRAERGDFSKVAGVPLPESARLDEIRARTAAMREETKLLKDLANPKHTPDQIALQAHKTRLANRIAELRERTAKGDFAPKPKRELVPDAEANLLQAEKEQVVVEYQRAREKKLWNDMNVFQKTGRTLVNTYDAARMLLTTGEFSFILRQGKFNVASHPIRSIRAIPLALMAMKSEAQARAIDLEIFNHTEYKNAKADRLAITDENAPLTKQEEIIAGRWTNVVPVVNRFNWAARVFLNKIRFDTWLAMRRSRERGGRVTPEAGRAIAAYVNESTGRGSLGGQKGEQAAVVLGRLLFSPRYLASRFQYAIGHSLWKKSDLRTKGVIATEYARTLIGMGIYYSLLNLYFNRDGDATIETDLRSNDALKVKKGNTRLDPMAGLAQIATFGMRTIRGSTITGKGKVEPIRGEGAFRKWRDVASFFLWTKAHPVPSTAADLLSGYDLVGNLVTPEGEAMEMSWPLTYKDIYQALKAQDLDDGAAMALLAFLGEGLNTYQPKKK